MASCKQSQCRHSRHGVINEIIYCSFPPYLEQAGLLRSDKKRPDGMSIFPWSSGRLLVWDTTCMDTFAMSNRSTAIIELGTVVTNTVRC